MKQSAALVDALKVALKQHGMTYAKIARALRMSEANIKRLFASKRFSLSRLEEICALVQMDICDLVALYDETRQRVGELSREQEQELVQDLKLLLVAVCVRNRLRFEDIIGQYQITTAECIHCLAKLDRLKIIDLLPGNRIKLRVGDNFRWLPDGPIEQFFEHSVQSKFIKSRFRGEDEKRLFLFGHLSEASRRAFLDRLQSLASDFAEMQRNDANVSLEKRSNVGVLLAFRPWDLDLFVALRKQRK